MGVGTEGLVLPKRDSAVTPKSARNFRDFSLFVPFLNHGLLLSPATSTQPSTTTLGKFRLFPASPIVPD